MSKPRTLPPTPQQIADALQCWLQCRAQGDNSYGVISSGYPYARLRKWAAERGIKVPAMRRGRKKSGKACAGELIARLHAAVPAERPPALAGAHGSASWEKTRIHFQMAKAAIKLAARNAEGAQMAAEHLERAAKTLREMTPNDSSSGT